MFGSFVGMYKGSCASETLLIWFLAIKGEIVFHERQRNRSPDSPLLVELTVLSDLAHCARYKKVPVAVGCRSSAERRIAISLFSCESPMRAAASLVGTPFALLPE